MTYSAHDADAQLAAARVVATAWLRATLALLPAAVTSLSVGAVLDEGGDRPTLAPRLRASVMGGEWSYPTGGSQGAEGTPLGNAMSAIYLIDDDLRTHTRDFLFALADEEWLTVTRADLASQPLADAPITRGDGPVLAAIIEHLTALPTGETTTILCHRSPEGVLTWNVADA